MVAIWMLISALLSIFVGAAKALQIAQFADLFAFLDSSARSYETAFTVVGVLLLATGLASIVLCWALLEAKPSSRTWAIVVLGLGALGWFVFVAIPLSTGFPASAELLIMGAIGVVNIMAMAYLFSREAVAHLEGAGPGYMPQGGAPGETVVHEVRREPVAQVHQAPPQPPIAPTEVAQRPPQVAGWLLVKGGGSFAGKQFELDRGRNRIGRDPAQCRIVLDNPRISAEHADIKFENGRFVVYDLASLNGTFVNGQRVQRQMLYDGDEVRLADAVTMVFKMV
jgi:hypothetical protein